MNIVDYDLLRMSKRQKFFERTFSPNNLSTLTNIDDLMGTADSRIGSQIDENSSQSNEFTSTNDTVPNWTQLGRQVK